MFTGMETKELVGIAYNSITLIIFCRLSNVW